MRMAVPSQASRFHPSVSFTQLPVAELPGPPGDRGERDSSSMAHPRLRLIQLLRTSARAELSTPTETCPAYSMEFPSIRAWVSRYRAIWSRRSSMETPQAPQVMTFPRIVAEALLYTFTQA